MDEALRHAAPDLHTQVPARVRREGWCVHWSPAGPDENAVKYLARYMHRTAISDERILAATDESVTFRYTDTATQERRECTLSADEFMRRYLSHVPPPGPHRVRYFGWMHPATKARRLKVDGARSAENAQPGAKRRVGRAGTRLTGSEDYKRSSPSSS